MHLNRRSSALPCPNCGYDVTGLPHNRCPECGNTFDRDEILRFAQRGWLRRIFTNNVTRWHVIAFIVVWLGFTVLYGFIAGAGVDKGADHNRQVFFTTVGSIVGPFAGALARGWQGCCLRASLQVFPYGAAPLALGVLLLFVRLPRNWAISTVRMLTWIIGWAAWFFAGLVSFAHAFS